MPHLWFPPVGSPIFKYFLFLFRPKHCLGFFFLFPFSFFPLSFPVFLSLNSVSHTLSNFHVHFTLPFNLRWPVILAFISSPNPLPPPVSFPWTVSCKLSRWSNGVGGKAFSLFQSILSPPPSGERMRPPLNRVDR
ncbi:hypothetical protein BDV23DRAFT_160767 [Aspergillus alliaceus]|uniref:Uncharacterized protein n=1 Tax=Petromyces alliaceus TaxID=209559 RepID=A0A5N7C0M1_PETAA|nr:hypothetical protein BDV23DRAFT_160767 [Aspergillus alliaceus]